MSMNCVDFSPKRDQCCLPGKDAIPSANRLLLVGSGPHKYLDVALSFQAGGQCALVDGAQMFAVNCVKR